MVEEHVWRNWRRSIGGVLIDTVFEEFSKKRHLSSAKGWKSGPGSEVSAPGKQGTLAGWSRRGLRDMRQKLRHNAGATTRRQPVQR